MRVLVFGASSTQGYWDTEGGWVARLRRHYDQLQIKLQSARSANEKNPIIFNLGISADTTNEILKRFEPETIARQRPEMAFIFSIGGNDSAVEDSKERCTPQQYADNIEALIKNARKFSDKIMFIGLTPADEELTTPVFWGNAHYTNQRILVFNEALQNVCSKHGIPYVSIFEEFKQKISVGENLYVDGLHPNNEGHELIFQLVRPELDKLIEPK